MRAFAVVAVLALVACQHTALDNRPSHSDLAVALDDWARASLSAYTFTIDYHSKGCRIATARVIVEDGLVADSTRILGFDPCAADRQESLPGFVDRSVSDLLAELVLFDEGLLPLDLGKVPIKAKFDDELGFPRYFRINAALDEKIFELPEDGSIPSDYEYTIVAFRVGANGT